MAPSTSIEPIGHIIDRLQAAFNALHLPANIDSLAFHAFAEEHINNIIQRPVLENIWTNAQTVGRFQHAEQLAAKFEDLHSHSLWDTPLYNWREEQVVELRQVLVEYFLTRLQIPVFRQVPEPQLRDELTETTRRAVRRASVPMNDAPTTGILLPNAQAQGALAAEFGGMDLDDEGGDDGGEGKGNEKGKDDSPGSKPSCRFCGEKFGSFDEVNMHEERKHPELFL